MKGTATPKELIYPAPNPDGSDADTRVEVGWSRDNYVQIGTTRHQNPGNLIVGEENAPTWDGWHMDLSRQQINDLIRVLRRARDQAYGRDE